MSSHSDLYKSALNNLICVAKSQCLNFSSKVNFNKYGSKDGQDLIPVSNHFIDTVILRSYQNHLPSSEDISLTIKVVESQLRFFFKSGDFNATSHTTVDNNCYIDFRLSLSQESIDHILNILSSDFMTTHNLLIWTIDITQDCSGSFDLTEMLDHFHQQHDLKIGHHPDNIYIEKDMVDKTGVNCLVWKNTKQNTRCKYYLKFPQFLQTCRVREDIGSRWFDWAAKEEYQTSIEKTSNRGMTRIEVTLYCNGTLNKSRTELCQLVDNARQMTHPDVIYATPHSKMWLAYADCLKHSLLVVDETITFNKNIGLALLVYSYDEISNRLSGGILKNWTSMKDRALSCLTFSSNLPVDVIRIEEIEMSETGRTLLCKTTRYTKVIKNGFNDVTYLTDKHCRLRINKADMRKQLETAGFQSHPFCTPAILNKPLHHASKLPAELHVYSEDTFTMDNPFPSKRMMNNMAPITDKSGEPFNIKELSQEQVRCLPIQNVRSIVRGHYQIYAIVKDTYPLLAVLINGELCCVYSNKSLLECLNKIKLQNAYTVNPDYSPIGKLTIKYHASSRGRKTTYSNIELY